MLRSLLNLGNEHLLRPLDLKIVRRSRVLSFLDDQDPKLDARRIAFFHAPKCGGTSINRWLAIALGGPAGIDPIGAEAAAHNLGLTGVEMREAILAYFVQRRHARLIAGHFIYSPRAFLGHEDEFDLITVLRNPLDRLLSHYYFNRFQDKRDHTPIDIDLSEWLSTDQAKGAATLFVKMFVGDMAVATALDRHGHWHDMRSAVASTIENLEEFAIVGILEHLRDFEAAVQQRHGITGRIGHLRKSPRPGYVKFADQPVGLQDRILEMCEADLTIYERFAPKAQTQQSLEPAD
jgi:hypothetical protein